MPEFPEIDGGGDVLAESETKLEKPKTEKAAAKPKTEKAAEKSAAEKAEAKPDGEAATEEARILPTFGPGHVGADFTLRF